MTPTAIGVSVGVSGGQYDAGEAEGSMGWGRGKGKGVREWG